jgi:hypothetical protein
VSEADNFRELIRRAREGDEAAATELVTKFGPLLRRELELRRMRDPALAPHIDASGLCDSVLAEFLLRLRGGNFELEDDNQVRALLRIMGRNRYADERDWLISEKRDVNRQRGDEALVAVSDGQASPSQHAANRELYEEVDRRFTDEERRLARGLAEGRTWPELAGPDRAAQDRLRHQLRAAFTRVAVQLNRLRPNERYSADHLQFVYMLGFQQAAGKEEQ